MENFLEKTLMNNLNEELVKTASPLVLAYIGDAVYEVYIRTLLISKGEVKVNALHKEGIKYVKAKAQADILKNISDKLTDEERDIIRRGRNITPASPPKNADIMDYRYATGFEALIGYLCVKKQYARLEEILKNIK